MIITLRNQTFMATPENEREKQVIQMACSSLITYKPVTVGFGKQKKRTYEVKDRYTLTTSDGSTIFLDSFFIAFSTTVFSNGIKRDDIKFVEEAKESFEKIELKSRHKHTADSQQLQYIEALTHKEDGRYLVDLYTGGGKTFLTLEALAVLSRRVLIVVKATYINKWIGDIKEYLHLEDEDILVLDGTDGVNQYMNNPTKHKFVLMSTTISSMWISDYEVLPSMSMSKFDYPPMELMKRGDIGIMLNDETHQHFHAVFKAILAYDPKKVIALSATLLTKDKKLASIHKLLFPKDNWLSFANYTPYIKARIVNYDLGGHIDEKRFKNAFGYSQKSFELMILGNPRLKKYVFNMIYSDIKEHYLSRRLEGDKALVFFDRVMMCAAFTEFLLEKRIPECDIRKYTGEDPYENLHGPDIIVSNLQSSGTAEDIKGLISVFNFVARDSITDNVQAAGRLRDKNERDKIYTQYYSNRITAHRRYKKEFYKIFEGRFVEVVEVNIPPAQ